jgi:acetyltransferase-like isoleucine patch superfamily enzyme
MAWRPDDEVRAMFHEVGENVLVSTRAVFYEPEKMRIGDHSRIDDFCLLSGRVSMGRNVHLAAYTHVAGGRLGVTFEDFSGCAYGCHVMTQSDDYSGGSLTNSTVPRRFKDEKFAAVRIGRHAILGTGTIVLPGCDVGEGASVGAGSIVSQSLEEWRTYVGRPARAVSARSRRALEVEAQYLKELSGPPIGSEGRNEPYE